MYEACLRGRTSREIGVCHAFFSGGFYSRMVTPRRLYIMVVQWGQGLEIS